MPQISPINWILIILLFSIVMSVTNILLPKFFTATPNKTNVMINNKKFSW